MTTQPTKQISPKLKQFQDELNELCTRYQFILKPSLSISANGILPTLLINDKVPPRKPIMPKVKKFKLKDRKGK